MTSPPMDAHDVRRLVEWHPGFSVRLNMVLGATGSVTDDRGTSHGLSNPQDRAVLTAIRANAQVLIVGGASVRAEGWFPLSVGNTIVLTSDATGPWVPPVDQHTEVRSYPHLDSTSLRDLITELHSSGLERILCEGGTTLTPLLLRSGMLTDINMTIPTRDNAQEAARDIAHAEALANERFPEMRDANLVREHAVRRRDMMFVRWRCATDE